MSRERDEAAPLNPASLAVGDTAQLLAKVSGEKITEMMIEADRTAGAPANPDGTLHLVHYAAWLAQEFNKETAGAD